MNRIVKRQGAAPAWVELNGEYEAELRLFRSMLEDQWTRRASRMILSGPLPLRRGLEDESRRAEVARSFRDREWAAQEQAYHAHEVARLNEIVRRHNHLAPFFARKGLLQLERELDDMYTRAVPLLVARITQGLRDSEATRRQQHPRGTIDQSQGQGQGQGIGLGLLLALRRTLEWARAKMGV